MQIYGGREILYKRFEIMNSMNASNIEKEQALDKNAEEELKKRDSTIHDEGEVAINLYHERKL